MQYFLHTINPYQVQIKSDMTAWYSVSQCCVPEKKPDISQEHIIILRTKE